MTNSQSGKTEALGRGIATCLVTLAVVVIAIPAAAQNSVSGNAFGVSANITGVGSVGPDPSVVLPAGGGTTEAHLLALDAPDILNTGSLTAQSTGSIGALVATASSQVGVEQANLVNGLVTADLVVAMASCTGNGTTATCSSVGTTILNLVVNGVPVGNITPGPNTVIPIPGIGTLTLNEQTTGGDNVASASLTVNLIHLNLDGTLGTGDLIVASAHADVSFTQPGSLCPCPQPVNMVSGEAFGSQITLSNMPVEKNPRALLASQGGSAQANVASVTLPGTLTSATEDQVTSGSITATNASTTTSSSVEQVNVLDGLVTGDLVHAMCACTGDGTTASCNDTGTQFVNVVVNGTPITVPVPPNTTIPIPGIGTVIVNEQTGGGDGMTTSSLTVNAVHVILTGNPSGDIIVASAHCDVDFAPGCRCGEQCPDFPFLVRTQGKVGDGGQVTGSIGANDDGGAFQFGKGAFVSDGSTTAGDSVSLGNGTSVGDVEANRLHVGKGATIRGSTGRATLPLSAPFCPIPPLACGGPDVVVPRGGAVELAPGSYGRLVALQQSAVVLDPGTFSFCDIKIGKNSAGVVTGGSQSTINDVGNFRLANGGFFGPVAGTPTPELNVGGTLVRVGAGAVLQAFLSAPNAQMRIGRGGQVRGSFCALTLRSDKGIVLQCLSP